MATPTSQKAGVRPISFLLQDLSNGNDLTSVPLVIRPGDLTRVQPSRATVQQTLGGAWLDNFGPGVSQVNISGHTGWRGGMAEDGMAAFKKLNNTVFTGWHEKRRLAIEAGRDPERVQLIFADLLDDFVYVVAPMSFTLRRNKQSPLLMQYQISMLVLSEDLVDLKEKLMPPAKLLDKEIAVPKALSMLREILGKIRGFAQTVAAFIEGTIGAAVKAFMELTADVLAVVTETVDSLKGSFDIVAGALISVASDLTQAGRNIMSVFASVTSLGTFVKSRLMEIGGAFSYAFCLLSNAFGSVKQFADYSSWFGASNCSAMSGGRPPSPLRFENPFYRLAPSTPTPVKQTPDARSAMGELVNLEVLSTTPDTAMESRIRSITSGTDVESMVA